MKYLGILVIAVLVLAGSVVMAGDYMLEQWGSIDTGRVNSSQITVPVTLQVWVYPYLYLSISHTGFRWHLYEAAPGEVYQEEVATATIRTNWPQVQLVFAGFDNPAKGTVEIPAEWGLQIGNQTWWKPADQVNGSYTKDVPFVGQEFTVTIKNKITIPQGGVVPGQYSNTGTITATLPSAYWP